MNSSSDSGSSFSIASILALIAAFLSFKAGAILGLLLALAAILFGALGVILALAPSKRGGIVSFLSIIAGGVGIVAAVIKAIYYFMH